MEITLSACIFKPRYVPFSMLNRRLKKYTYTIIRNCRPNGRID